MKNKYFLVLLISLIFINLNAKNIEAKKLCDNEIKKDKPNLEVVKTQCLKTAKFYEEQKSYVNASWYYLVAKENHYNIKKLAKKAKRSNNSIFYANIGHSCVLEKKLSFTKIFYKYFLMHSDVPWANKVIQDDYKLLFKLYPNKKAELTESLNIWNNLYKPLLPINELYPKYKKALHEKKYEDAILNLSMIIKIQVNSKLQIKKFQLKNYIKLGKTLSSAGSYQEAVDIFLRIKKQYENNNYNTTELKLLIAQNNENIQYRNYHKKVHTSTMISEKDLIGIGISDIFAKLAIASGNYTEAMTHYKNSLKMREEKVGENHILTSTSYNDIGSVYQLTGKYKKSLLFLNKSLKIREKVLGKNHSDTAVTYNNLGLLNISIKKYKTALNFLNKSLKIREKVLGKENIITSNSYNNIGLVYYLMRNYDKALKYYKKSLKIREKLLGVEYSDTAISYYNIGLLYKTIGNYPLAYKYAKKSYDSFIKDIDKVFISKNNQEKKFYLELHKNKLILLLSATYLYATDMDNKTQGSLYKTTFNDWLNYKGSIYDSENVMITLYENTKDKTIKEKIKSFVQLKRNLSKLYQTLPRNKEEKLKNQENIKSIIKSISDIEIYISSKAISFKEELGLRNINYKDISSNLKDSELYIDYAKVGKYYYVFTLDNKNNITFNQINKKDTKNIDKYITDFRNDIDIILNNTILSDDDLSKLKVSSEDKLSKLYKLVLYKPLKNILSKYSNLIISSDSMLRLLPFGTMFDKINNKYLIEKKSIKYIPSGKELVRLYKQKEINIEDKVVLFDNPNFDAKNITVTKVDTINVSSTKRSGIIKSLFKMRFIALPGTKEEVKNIKQTLKHNKIEEFSKDEANELNLLSINQPKILHIATHGFFINDNNIPNPMLKSGIALSGANASAIRGKSDGIVTSLKLSGLNLKGTQLVVLSACQTGVVDINSTENVSGLNKAFIQAGAKNIVMSLWSVADKETSQLMSSFYKEINNNNNYSKSLQKAKLSMIKNNLHPFYWGAFILSGD
jgi:CHAT domain-containing protein